MKRKLKTLTEQFTDARTNYNRILGRSDKQLMNEQNYPTSHYYRGYGSPNGAPNCQKSGIQVWRKNNNANTFYQAIGSPSPGEWIGFEHGLSGWGTNGYACLKYYGTTVPTGDYFSGMHVNSEGFNIDYNSINITTSTGDNDCGPCFAGQQSTSGCDPSAWSNHSNWITTWTSLPNFTSSNPNQPCNMICNKLQIWNNNLTNAGPVQANQLECKIEEGENQSQIHGCNC